LAQRRHLGTDLRFGYFGNTGRSRHSGGLIPDLLGVGRTAGLRMIKKRRLPGAGERVKVGRRLVTLPGVTAMTKSIRPATKPNDSELEKPTDELTEELARTVKAAYQ
jgi:hypothetical protein